MRIIYRIYFRSMHMANMQNWKQTKPTVLVCNHVNAFLDPIVLPAQTRQKVYFIVRGDIFTTPVMRWSLWQLNQLPMFRRRDGINSVKRNEETFDRCYDLLKRNKRVMIFPEGNCVQEKHLRPLQKGAARMVFGAMEKHGWDLDVHIQSTSAHYSNPSNFRTDVTTNVGKSIPVQSYRELYENDPNQAITQLTQELEENLRDHYIQMNDKADLDLFDQLAEVQRNDYPSTVVPWRRFNNERYDREKALSDRINELRENNPDALEQIRKKTDTYKQWLKKVGLRDRDMSASRKNSFLGTLFVLLGFPLYALGYALNLIQFKIGDNKAQKTREVIFRNSTRLVLIMLSNLALLLPVFVVLLFVHVGLAFGVVIGFWLLAFYTINFHEYKRDLKYTYRYSGLLKKQEKVMNKLAADRKEIQSFWA